MKTNLKNCCIALGLQLCAPLAAHAAIDAGAGNSLLNGVILTVLFGGLGIALMVLSYVIIDRITPGNLGREIVEQKNIALAIVVGSMVIGMSIIIAAAVSG